MVRLAALLHVFRSGVAALGVAAIATAMAAVAATAGDDRFIAHLAGGGVWSGPVDEADLRYSIELRRVGRSIVVGYPELNCFGTWTPSAASEDRPAYVERITDGLQNCLSPGYVVLIPVDEDSYRFEWSETPESPPYARGVLNRKPPPKQDPGGASAKNP